jgi:hypothetical protein
LEAIEVESHIHLSSHSGSGLSAETEIPVTASKLEIDGPDLQPAQIGVSGSGHRKITFNWETAGVLDRNIIIRYQLPNAEPGRSWEIETPRFGQELSPQTCLTVITPLPGTAVQTDNGQTGSEVAQLPYWIQSKLVAPEFYVIRFVDAVRVSTRLLPVLKPDNARISVAAYQTSFVPDGSLKCEALFKIEYRRTFSWRFRLPEGSVLLDCQMNSNPASPVVKNAVNWSFPSRRPLIQEISTRLRYRLPTPRAAQSSNRLKVNSRFHSLLPSSLSNSSNGGFICLITMKPPHSKAM